MLRYYKSSAAGLQKDEDWSSPWFERYIDSSSEEINLMLDPSLERDSRYPLGLVLETTIQDELTC